MIDVLNAELFRQKLAGLVDEADGESDWAEQYREIASDFVLLLAIGFNRKELDAKTLWTRIDSAIQKGLAECDGIDVERLMSSCLSHVMAPINVVATQEKALEIQATITKLPKERRAYFCSYLAKHRYAAIVLGREKWESQKQVQKEARQLAEVDAEAPSW